jgi:DNA polymerase/3'-5' exonuclease PolX
MKHLKTYGEHLEEAILLPGQAKIKRADAIAIAKTIIDGMGFEYVDPDTVSTTYSFVKKCGIPVGSIRRKKPEVGDVDIIITAPIDINALRKQPWAKHVGGGDKQVNFIYETPGVQRKINLFSFTDPHSFGGALLHTTGSHQYNIRLRAVAMQRGFSKLSQHGLFDDAGKMVAGPTEASIQQMMRVTQREPKDREK